MMQELPLGARWLRVLMVDAGCRSHQLEVIIHRQLVWLNVKAAIVTGEDIRQESLLFDGFGLNESQSRVRFPVFIISMDHVNITIAYTEDHTVRIE